MNSTTNRTTCSGQSECLETENAYFTLSLPQTDSSSSNGNSSVNHTLPKISQRQYSRRQENVQKVIRKLEGYLSHIEEDEAVVCFLENGQDVEMIVPARPLIQNGIIREGQPFVFMESEKYNRDSQLWENIFSYSPLCKENEYTREMLPISIAVREKLDELLKQKC